MEDEFGVPSLLLHIHCCMLEFLFHITSLRDEHNKEVFELIDSSTELVIPTFVNSVPTKVFPGLFLNREGITVFLDFGTKFRETKGCWTRDLHTTLHCVSDEL